TEYPEFIHSEQDATVNGLESVAHIRESAGNDHRHRIIDVGRFHFLFYVDPDDFFSFCHENLALKNEHEDT
ncbi:MAG: hypothetical protein RLZZ46_314, partial [Bacteroidota bacterium]